MTVPGAPAAGSGTAIARASFAVSDAEAASAGGIGLCSGIGNTRRFGGGGGGATGGGAATVCGAAGCGFSAQEIRVTTPKLISAG